MVMVPKIPNKIRNYVTNIDTVPTVEIKGTKWFIVSQKEFNTLNQYIKTVDSVPENEWRKWGENKISEIGMSGNFAERIVRNCVVRDDSEQGYHFVSLSELTFLK